MIDLHSHSTASDGRLTPTALVELAAGKALRALALTDHDTTDGLAEASAAAVRVGIEFVPGIEIEIETQFGEFHLLGLGLRDWSGRFSNEIARLQAKRKDRNLKIFEKMKEAGIRGEYSDVEALAQGGQVGRPHFARYLVAKGKVKSIQDAFTHFLARGQLFYEKKAGLELAHAVELIHEAGGKAIVAHPMSLYLSIPRLEEQLVEYKALGLDGIEAWHPGAPVRVCRKLERLAQKLGLIATAGSDFHGENRPDRKLGQTSGETPIEDAYFENLFGRPPRFENSEVRL